jgi:poly(beta-D-mannuronate) lyase
MKKYFISISLLMLFGSISYAKTYRAENIASFNQIKSELLPGDTLILANGTWDNADLVITNKGTKQSPIVFIAETMGKVIFTGNSKINIGGDYVEVNGFVFKHGYVLDGGVIEFRESEEKLANYCRVTNCVIDDYNKPDRLTEDNWVRLYGRHNRFDHNYIVDKKNLGTTLVVILNDKRNQENENRIDHNYFGKRPRLGSNGGETIRIGTSTFSRTSSKTIVEDNYFEHCNGEVEIISVKSLDNIVRRNTFFECEGTLTLRHGDNTTIDGNFFIGNNKPNTGGVRVINAHHKIYNNFFYELAGDGFRSALAILNGVPN